MHICPRWCEGTSPITPSPETAGASDGTSTKSNASGRNGCRGGEAGTICGPAFARSSTTIRYRRPGSFTNMQSRANLLREEPDAGILHVRVCEGWGWQHSHLLGLRQDKSWKGGRHVGRKPFEAIQGVRFPPGKGAARQPEASLVVGVSVMPPISRLGLVQLPSWRRRNANVPALDVCNGVTSSNLYVP